MSDLAGWWRARQPRERVLLALGVGALLAALYWIGIVEPATLRAARLVTAIAAERETQQWLVAQRARLPAAAPATRGRLPDGASLLAAINDSAATNAVAGQLTRVTAAGARGVTLGFTEVPYTGFMRWLLAVDAEYGATVERVRVERAAAPGVVNVELALTF